MIPYPEINPIALDLGPIQIHWYGIAYLLSFVVGWRLVVIRTKQDWSPIKKEQAEDLIFYTALGVILGGRIGYVFFYGFDRFLENPLWLLKIWEGGMSFHGGFLGVCAALVLFARRNKIPFWPVIDLIAIVTPIGLGLGRLGNFIGQELWGRPTDSVWGMVFPKDPLQLPRHASQLYEFALEGVLLFMLLWILSAKQRPIGFISGVFLLEYGMSRFLVEFVREPDAHLADSLLFGWMTRGQQLSLPMVVAGIIMIIYVIRAKNNVLAKF